MVSVGVSKLGCTAIHFVEPGVKVNGEYYRNNLLGQKLLPDMRRLSQDEFFCVSTGRRPGTSITFLEQQTPDFIPLTLWPPNSPDLKPVDYSVWSVLQEKVYRSKIADIDELKTRLVNEWAHRRSSTSRSLMPRSASGAAVWALVSVHVGHNSSISSDNFEQKCYRNL